MAFAVFTRDERAQMAALVLWLLELPKPGVHVGGGIHVALPESAPNPCPLRLIGWTTRHVQWVAKPANTGASTDEYAIRATSNLVTAWQAKKSQLTAVERNWVQSHLDSAAELAAAWQVNGELRETEDVEPEP